MNLYLLCSKPEQLGVFHKALQECRLIACSVSDISQIPFDSPELPKSVLIVHCALALEHPEDMATLTNATFDRRAVVCDDSCSADAVAAVAGERWDLIVGPNTAALRPRIADWLRIESLARQVADHARQSQDLGAALEASSRDLTSLRQKISLLDHQQEKLSGVLETQNMLGTLSQEINCLDLEEIINVCVTKIPLLVNARYASFYVYNHEQKTLELKRHNHGYRIDDVVRVTSQSKSAMCRAVAERRVLLIPDFAEYERLHDIHVERPNAKRYASKSAIIAPMLASDRVVAVLNLADKRSGASFDEVVDLPPIEQLSVLVGAAIRNWQLFQEVQLRARTDAMTGFVNHQTFFEELEKEVLRVRRYHGALAVLMVDVDNFKSLNDVHGHQVGDYVLSQVARIIRLNVRDTDVTARYGGDEFAVILGQADVARGKLVAERIREMVEAEEIACKQSKLRLSVSIGVAQYRAGFPASSLVSDADKALYEAKARGRNRVEAMIRP